MSETKYIDNLSLRKQLKEEFSAKGISKEKNMITKLIDEILSYFPFYFRWPINFFRRFIENSWDDPMNLVYVYIIFVLMKVYIRGRVLPATEAYYETMI